ncbi:hypothetical protein GCM10010517_75420 [Streptosporangium fragile]|uniref:WD40 repeat domain-containing protein n=1 Tax=Streptosporangium fragile TaxID=46186 RepID=A0ABN3WBL6_9ACTN
MTDLEDALTRTFTRAATRAPAAPPDFVRQVDMRYVRRRRGRSVAVAAAVTAVVAGSVLGTRVLSTTSPAPAVKPDTTVSQAAPAVVEVAPPIERVWPRAVHEIPAGLPNGQAFNADLFLDDRTVVGRALRGGPALKPGIWSYDLDSGKFTSLATLTAPSVASLVAGDGFLAWSTLNKRTVEIWTIPAKGGTPRKITSFLGVSSGEDTYHGIDMTIADGKVAWSPAKDGGVYQVPLSGGEPTLVPGTERHHLLRWPWAGYPTHDVSGLSGGPAKEPPMAHLLNVRTGERSDAVTGPGEKGWTCGVTWCVTFQKARHRDGTGERNLPGSVSLGGPVPYSGRFLLLYQQGKSGERGASIYDLSTGRAAALVRSPARKGDTALPTIHLRDGLFSYKRGNKQVLVNLGAVK